MGQRFVVAFETVWGGCNPSNPPPPRSAHVYTIQYIIIIYYNNVTVHEKTKHIALDIKSRYKPIRRCLMPKVVISAALTSFRNSRPWSVVITEGSHSTKHTSSFFCWQRLCPGILSEVIRDGQYIAITHLRGW